MHAWCWYGWSLDVGLIHIMSWGHSSKIFCNEQQRTSTCRVTLSVLGLIADGGWYTLNPIHQQGWYIILPAYNNWSQISSIFSSTRQESMLAVPIAAFGEQPSTTKSSLFEARKVYDIKIVTCIVLILISEITNRRCWDVYIFVIRPIFFRNPWCDNKRDAVRTPYWTPRTSQVCISSGSL